jgi:hypothetical protein
LRNEAKRTRSSCALSALFLVDGREAANPFRPKEVPFNSCCASTLTDIFFRPILPA